MFTDSGTMSRLSGLHVPRGSCQLALLLLPLLLGPSSVLAISFHLPINSRKCLREEIHKDLLVTGAYEITDQSGGAGGLRTHLKVRPGAGRDGKGRRTSGVGAERPRMGVERGCRARPPRGAEGGQRRPPPRPEGWRWGRAGRRCGGTRRRARGLVGGCGGATSALVVGGTRVCFGLRCLELELDSPKTSSDGAYLWGLTQRHVETCKTCSIVEI